MQALTDESCDAAPVIGWRWPFIIVAIPAVLMAFLMVLTVPEPPRGVTEDAIQVRQAELSIACHMHALYYASSSQHRLAASQARLTCRIVCVAYVVLLCLH